MGTVEKAIQGPALKPAVWVTEGDDPPREEIQQALVAGYDVVEIITKADNKPKIVGAMLSSGAEVVLGKPPVWASALMFSNALVAIQRGRWMTTNIQKALVGADVPWLAPLWLDGGTRCSFVKVGRLRCNKVDPE